MTDAKRLLEEATPPSAWRAGSREADAWMDGYSACWTRLNEAGRLIPSNRSLPDYEAAVEALERLIAALDGAAHGLFEEWPATRGAVQAEGVLVADLEPDIYNARVVVARLRDEVPA